MSAIIIINRGEVKAGIRGDILDRTNTHIKVDVTSVEYGEIQNDW